MKRKFGKALTIAVLSATVLGTTAFGTTVSWNKQVNTSTYTPTDTCKKDNGNSYATFVSSAASGQPLMMYSRSTDNKYQSSVGSITYPASSVRVSYGSYEQIKYSGWIKLGPTARYTTWTSTGSFTS